MKEPSLHSTLGDGFGGLEDSRLESADGAGSQLAQQSFTSLQHSSMGFKSGL
ncbi:hypothetical protein HUA78_41590 [Myxococcus sp. CA033]|nr:hypothetical protein [Myxococcus sp. CA033]